MWSDTIHSYPQEYRILRILAIHELEIYSHPTGISRNDRVGWGSQLVVFYLFDCTKCWVYVVVSSNMAGNVISMEFFKGTSSINGACICDGTMIYTTLDSDEGDHWSMFNLHNVNDYLKYNVS